MARKKNRQSNPFIPGRGGEWGPRTPVETRELSTRSREADVNVVQLQASWTNLALVTVVLSLIILTMAVGDTAFWIGAGAISTAAFVWTLLFAQHRHHEYDEWVNDRGPTILDLATAFLYSALAGFVALCVNRFLTFVGFQFPPAWARPVAFFTFLTLIYSGGMWLHLEVRFGQEMIFASFHQELAVWEAFREIAVMVAKALLPFIARRDAPDPMPRMYDRGRRVATNGRAAAQEAFGLTDDDMATVPNEPDREALDVMEFLITGQHIEGEDGEPILYSRRRWNGRKLSSGTKVTTRKARRWAEALADVGVLEDAGDGFDLASGLSLGEALDSFVVARAISPPSPDQVKGWLADTPPPHRVREWFTVPDTDPSRPTPSRSHLGTKA